MATIMESLNCIVMKLIDIFWFQNWVWLQNEVVLICTTPLPNQLSVECRSVLRVQHRDWQEWKSPKFLPLWVKSLSRWTVQFCVCFLPNHIAFSTVRMLGVSQEGVSKIFWRNRDTGPPHQAWGSEESDHSPRRQTVDSNGDTRFISAPFLCTRGDDPPISEEVVISEHCKQASVCWLSL